METGDKSFFEGFSGTLLENLDPTKLNWKEEIKYVGGLAGSVTGSYMSTQLGLSLALRIVTVIGSAYGGAVVATLGYSFYAALADQLEDDAEQEN